jgi:hypothetical protein
MEDKKDFWSEFIKIAEQKIPHSPYLPQLKDAIKDPEKRKIILKRLCEELNMPYPLESKN